MASCSPLSLLFLALLLISGFSIPAAQSQKAQLSRRYLALSEQQQEEQPIPKPKSKKKVVDLQEEEEGATPKPKSKKKIAELQEEEEDESTQKPKSKKKITGLQQEAEEATQKPKSRKKVAEELQEEEEEEAVQKPKPKKKITALQQDEESEEAIQQTPKSKKKIATLQQDEDEGEATQKPKSKKKIAEVHQDEEATTKKKIPTLDSKNQTKALKTKKSNSTSTPKLNKTLTKVSTKPTITIKPTKLNSSTTTTTTTTTKPKPKPVSDTVASIWLDEPDSDPDLISEFRDLPTRIHQSLIPDLKKISITSKAYIYKANKHIADNVKPFVGKQFAPKVATAASCAFLVLPLCLVTALLYLFNSYLSLHRFLLFAQAYLAIYFMTLAVTAAATGLEPLRLFHATSPASYAWTQAVQTLGYLMYLLAQLVHLVVVFSGGGSEGKAAAAGAIRARALGLAQMVVGLAVGCHYYAAVFHRAVTGEPPRANWRVHAVYAGCFLLICLCARAERGKKAYDGGEDGKKN